MRVVAHRGNSSVAPQNTLAAFEAAWRAGADAIELDVQLTADRQVVVIHDDTVDATTDGTGPVAGLTLAQVRALDAGGWFSPAFAGQRVPAFDEVVGLLLDRPGIDLLCEVKGAWTPDEAALVTEPLLADPGFVARQHALGREVTVWTLDEPWMWRTAADLYVDGVITDRPDRLRGWLAAADAR